MANTVELKYDEIMRRVTKHQLDEYSSTRIITDDVEPRKYKPIYDFNKDIEILPENLVREEEPEQRETVADKVLSAIDLFMDIFMR